MIYGHSDEPHPIKIDSGIFLRATPPNVITYANSAPLFFNINFEFLTRITQNRNLTIQDCNKNSRLAHVNCLQLRYLSSHIETLQQRLDTLLSSFTADAFSTTKTFLQEDTDIFSEQIQNTIYPITRPPFTTKATTTTTEIPTTRTTTTTKPPTTESITTSTADPFTFDFDSTESNEESIERIPTIKPFGPTQPIQVPYDDEIFHHTYNDDPFWYDITGPIFHNIYGVATQADVKPLFDSIAIQANKQNLVIVKDTIEKFSTDYQLLDTQFSQKWKEFINFQKYTNRNLTNHFRNLRYGELRILSTIDEITQELTFLTELFHYNSILQDCKANHLPLSAISQNTLRSTLSDL